MNDRPTARTTSPGAPTTAAPAIAPVAALIGDPARAAMLCALMDGRALTASELGEAAGVAPPTASGHLAKLADAGLVVVERQGRHRYVRLAGADVAALLEGMMAFAARHARPPIRTGPGDRRLRAARVCYDHLAGEAGVELLDALFAGGLVAAGAVGADRPAPTAAGRAVFAAVGIDVAALEARRRPLCRTCLDWSQRRHHLAGGLGAAILTTVIARGWARRGAGRVVAFTPVGRRAFDAAFGIPALSDG
jgi:DNA-binding transcriptional ArsR family regulator